MDNLSSGMIPITEQSIEAGCEPCAMTAREKYYEDGDYRPVENMPTSSSSRSINQSLGLGNGAALIRNTLEMQYKRQISDDVLSEKSLMETEGAGAVVSEDESSSYEGITEFVDVSDPCPITDNGFHASNVVLHEEGPVMAAGDNLSVPINERELTRLEDVGDERMDVTNGLPSSSTAIDLTITTAPELDQYLPESDSAWLEEDLLNLKLDPICYDRPHQSNIHGKVERYQMKFTGDFRDDRFRFGRTDSVKGGGSNRQSYVDCEIHYDKNAETPTSVKLSTTTSEGESKMNNYLKLQAKSEDWVAHPDGTISSVKLSLDSGYGKIPIPPVYICRVPKCEAVPIVSGEKRTATSSSKTHITARLFAKEMLVASVTSNEITDTKLSQNRRKDSWLIKPTSSRVNDCKEVEIIHEEIRNNTISSVVILIGESLSARIIKQEGKILTIKMPHIQNEVMARVDLMLESGEILVSLWHEFKPDSLTGRKRGNDGTDDGPDVKSRLRDILVRKKALQQ